MSHRDDCPDRWEARREGERAFDRGFGRNPYKPDIWGERGCEEAAYEWKRGYRSAELRDEERQEEERWNRRREEALVEERAHEDRLMQEAEMQARYEAEMHAQYEADMRAQEEDGDEREA